MLHSADGQALDVPHLGFISISRSGHRVIVEAQNDWFEVVDTMRIVTLEVKPPSETAA